MKDLNPHLLRRRDEREKFRHLIKTLVWIKEQTGKPSGEIISIIMRRGKRELVELSY